MGRWIQQSGWSNANLAELNQLSHLTTLRVCMPDAQIIPSDLFIQELKRFKILIGDVGNWSHNIEASKTLKLKFNKISYSGYGLIKRLLKITDDLFLDELNDVQDVLHELDEEGFNNLKYLHVQNGPKLRYVVNTDGQIPCDAFLMLESLSLDNLVDLVKICHGRLKEASFNKLKAVKVNKCDELKHLFSISMAKCLSHLQELEVTNCKSLQAIFAEENDRGRSHDDREANSKIKFTQLRSINLQLLPQFRSFCFNMETPLISRTEIIVEDDPDDFKTIEFPCLENLILSSINIENISSVNNSYHTLRILVVKRCSGLKFLFSSSMVKSLMQLQQLQISNCELMEEVIDSKGLEGDATISFPKLEYLILENLPNLKRFGVGNLVEFPVMIWLSIESCPNLMTFFSNSTSEITRNETEEMNSEQSVQPLFHEKIEFPCLENLALSSIDIENISSVNTSYHNLRRLHVKGSSGLKFLFSSSMVKSLMQLQNIHIFECKVMEEVIDSKGLEGEATISFPELKSLILMDLPHLKRFGVGNLVEFPLMTHLSIVKCPNLMTFFSNSTCEITRSETEEMNSEQSIQPLFNEKVSLPNLDTLATWDMDTLRGIWEQDQVNLDSFNKLQEIIVGDCNQLLHIFPSIMYGRLQKLEKLWVSNCNSLEMILKLEALGGRDEIVFKELKLLRLRCLPSLRGFYTGNCTLKLPSLDDVIVGQCSKMEFFSQGMVNSSKLRGVNLITGEKNEETGEQYELCREWEGDLNTTIQHIFRKLNAKTSEQD